MDYIRRNLKRILIDAAGYLLLLAAVLTGWLPGPGGIPLAIAGLGLLSINNKWAKDLRDYLLKNGGKVVQILFPKTRLAEWGYDILAVLLFVLCLVLEWQHAAIWQVSAGIFAFFIAIVIALLNRDRLHRVRPRGKHKH